MGLGGVLFVFVWRVISTGVAAHFDATVRSGLAGAQAAIAWSHDQSDAFLAQGDAKRGDPAAAAESYQAAVRADPTAALALVKLALVWQSLMYDAATTHHAVRTAVRLTPSDPTVRGLAAQFWLNADRWAEAGVEWSSALAASPRLETRLFPLFLSLGENPPTAKVLETMALQPPVWWPRFLSYVAKNAVQLDTVRSLFALTRAGGLIPERGERRALIERLQNEQHWNEAYLEWLDSLAPEQRTPIGLLYNGSFDFPIEDAGFDWRRVAPSSIRIEQAPAAGLDGPYGLRVTFDHVAQRGRIVEQILLLTPGRYRLEGQVRVSRRRDAAADLRWELSCVNDTKTLAQTDSFTEVEPWHDFNAVFEVAESCLAQRLRLAVSMDISTESSSSLRSVTPDKQTTEVWFDALRVVHLAGTKAGK